MHRYRTFGSRFGFRRGRFLVLWFNCILKSPLGITTLSEGAVDVRFLCLSIEVVSDYSVRWACSMVSISNDSKFVIHGVVGITVQILICVCALAVDFDFDGTVRLDNRKCVQEG